MDVLIFNPLSKKDFRKSFPDAKVIVSESAEHIRRICSDGGFDRVIVNGGDGTLHHVVNGIMEGGQKPEVIPLPAGSGNDFLRSLEKRTEADIGLIEMDGRNEWFVNTAGLGFASRIVEKTEKPGKGKLTYLLSALSNLISYSGEYIRYEADEYDEDILFQIDVCNGKFYGNGMMVSPNSDISDGLLDVIITELLGLQEAIPLIPKIYSGTHLAHPKVKAKRVREFKIFSEHLIHADGEIVGTGPASFRIGGKLTFSPPSLLG